MASLSCGQTTGRPRLVSTRPSSHSRAPKWSPLLKCIVHIGDRNTVITDVDFSPAGRQDVRGAVEVNGRFHCTDDNRRRGRTTAVLPTTNLTDFRVSTLAAESVRRKIS